MKRILVVKFWALGDILMATPVLRALKELYEDASIDWLVDNEFAGVLDNNPLIDRLITFDSGTWRRNYRRFKVAEYLQTSFALRKSLLAHGYDIVLFLTAEKWWVQWFNVAPVSIGLFPGPSSGALGPFYTKCVTVPASGIGHSTDHYLRTIDALGGNGNYNRTLIYSPSERDAAEAERFLAESGAYDFGRKTIVLHPGSSQETKCWPIDSFAGLAAKLHEYNIVITGSVKEFPLAEKIAGLSGGSANITIAAGKVTRLGETGAIVRRSAAVVTNDTSVLHIASALDIPVVGLFGATRPSINEPLFGVKSLLFDDSVKCAPCYKGRCRWSGVEHMRCFRSITPDLVYSHVIGIMGTVDHDR